MLKEAIEREVLRKCDVYFGILEVITGVLSYLYYTDRLTDSFLGSLVCVRHFFNMRTSNLMPQDALH